MSPWLSWRSSVGAQCYSAVKRNPLMRKYIGPVSVLVLGIPLMVSMAINEQLQFDDNRQPLAESAPLEAAAEAPAAPQTYHVELIRTTAKGLVQWPPKGNPHGVVFRFSQGDVFVGVDESNRKLKLYAPGKILRINWPDNYRDEYPDEYRISLVDVIDQPLDLQTRREPWPADWPIYQQGDGPRCNVTIGCCSCGQWHLAGMFEYDAEAKVLKRWGEVVPAEEVKF